MAVPALSTHNLHTGTFWIVPGFRFLGWDLLQCCLFNRDTAWMGEEDHWDAYCGKLPRTWRTGLFYMPGTHYFPVCQLYLYPANNEMKANVLPSGTGSKLKKIWESFFGRVNSPSVDITHHSVLWFISYKHYIKILLDLKVQCWHFNEIVFNTSLFLSRQSCPHSGNIYRK